MFGGNAPRHPRGTGQSSDGPGLTRGAGYDRERKRPRHLTVRIRHVPARNRALETIDSRATLIEATTTSVHIVHEDDELFGRIDEIERTAASWSRTTPRAHPRADSQRPGAPVRPDGPPSPCRVKPSSAHAPRCKPHSPPQFAAKTPKWGHTPDFRRAQRQPGRPGELHGTAMATRPLPRPSSPCSASWPAPPPAASPKDSSATHPMHTSPPLTPGQDLPHREQPNHYPRS